MQIKIDTQILQENASRMRKKVCGIVGAANSATNLTSYLSKGADWESVSLPGYKNIFKKIDQRLDEMSRRCKKIARAIDDVGEDYEILENRLFREFPYTADGRKKTGELTRAFDMVIESLADYENSIYKAIIDGYGMGKYIAMFQDYFVDVEVEDIEGAFGGNKNAEDIILLMVQKDDGASEAFDELLEQLDDALEEFTNVKDATEGIDKILGNEAASEIFKELLNEMGIAVEDMKKLGYILKFINVAADTGEEAIAYQLLTNKAKFDELEEIILATGDEDLIKTYYIMKEKMDNAFETAVVTAVEGAGLEIAKIALDATPVGPILMAKDLTSMGCNYVFRSGDAADHFTKLLECQKIEESLAVASEKAREEFRNNPTPETFDAMIKALEAQAELDRVANQIAHNMYEDMDKALLKKNEVTEIKNLLADADSVAKQRLKTLEQLKKDRDKILEGYSQGL